MSIEIELEIASNAQTLPHPSQFKEWIAHTLHNRIDEADILIRIVDEDEMKQVNLEHRGHNKATNILSFPYHHIPEKDVEVVGDILLCPHVIEIEANNEDKELIAHWAHLVIHGTLHLMGYLHNNEEDAIIMETLEIEILENLGYQNPYIGNSD